MSIQKVAVVTGGNKGIGYAIVKGLCEKYEGVVYLTARDVGRGEATVSKLKEQGLNPSFHQLDINDQNSIDRFKEHLIKTHGGLDVLINNAAIAYSNGATEPFSEQAEVSVAVNYFSTLRVCQALFPILRQNARVVNVSSALGHLSKIPSPELRAKLNDPALTVPQLSKLMEEFVEAAKNNKNEQLGWGKSAYAVSKVGFSALTKIQQREFDAEAPNRNISVNSLHPGYVATDMSNFKGPETIEQGARAPLWLALEADQSVKGQFVWKDCTLWPWDAEDTPAYY